DRTTAAEGRSHDINIGWPLTPCARNGHARFERGVLETGPLTGAAPAFYQCTLALVAWLTYCRSPWIDASAAWRCTMKPKVPIPLGTSIEPPPVTFPTVGGAGNTMSVIFATKGSTDP